MFASLFPDKSSAPPFDSTLTAILRASCVERNATDRAIHPGQRKFAQPQDSRAILVSPLPEEETKMSIARIVLGLGLAAFATGAAAQDRRPDYGPSINLTAAKKIAAGTIAECQKNSWNVRSEEHTSELQSLRHLVCR